jgi:hypothetical protein
MALVCSYSRPTSCGLEGSRGVLVFLLVERCSPATHGLSLTCLSRPKLDVIELAAATRPTSQALAFGKELSHLELGRL